MGITKYINYKPKSWQDTLEKPSVGQSNQSRATKYSVLPGTTVDSKDNFNTPNADAGKGLTVFDNISTVKNSIESDSAKYGEEQVNGGGNDDEGRVPITMEQKQRAIGYTIRGQQGKVNPYVGRVLSDSEQKKYEKSLSGAETIDKAENNGIDNYHKFLSELQDNEYNKRKRLNLIINAIGDSVRNMGNLYYTTKGAPPQAIANNTQAIWEQYENERKEKEAKEAAAEKIAREQANKDRDYEMKKRSADEKSEEHGWKKEDRPIDRANKENTYLGNASDTRVKLATEGDRVKQSVSKTKEGEANATSAGVKAKYAEENEILDIQGKRLRNANTAANTKKTKAEASKLSKESQRDNNSHPTFPVFAKGRDGKMHYIDGYKYISNSKAADFNQNVARNVANYLRVRGWIKQGTDENTSDGLNAILSAAAQHADDEQVQRVLRDLYGTPVNTKSGKKGSARRSGSSFGGIQ